MQPPRCRAATGQGDIQGFGSQLARQGGGGKGITLGIVQGFKSLFDGINCRARRFALFGGQATELFKTFGQLARFAQIAGFNLFETCGVRYRIQGNAGGVEYRVKGGHGWVL